MDVRQRAHRLIQVVKSCVRDYRSEVYGCSCVRTVEHEISESQNYARADQISCDIGTLSIHLDQCANCLSRNIERNHLITALLGTESAISGTPHDFTSNTGWVIHMFDAVRELLDDPLDINARERVRELLESAGKNSL